MVRVICSAPLTSWRSMVYLQCERALSMSTSVSIRTKSGNGGKVVITGLGCLSPVGCNVSNSWRSVISGENGIERIADIDPSDCSADILRLKQLNDLPIKLVGRLKDESFNDTVSRADLNSTSRFVRIAAAAAEEALTDADWDLTSDRVPCEKHFRTGVSVGSGVGSLQEIEESTALILNNRARRISPYMVPKILINMTSGYISRKYNIMGPNISVVSACATGVHSIADGCRMIRCGEADVMVVGAAEACLAPLAFHGFHRMKALTTADDLTASRPFDISRSGFVVSEGGAAMILESEEHAIKRNVKRIYAEVAGYCLSGDAYHVAQPHPEGLGAEMAMKGAIAMSGTLLEDIGYVNAHATSTPVGDIVEAQVIHRLFRHCPTPPAVSSLKGGVGHTLGAAGAIESVLSVMALHELASITYAYNMRTLSKGVLPPNLHLEERDHHDEAVRELDLISGTARNRTVEAVLKNSFGFGGTNGSIVFKRYHPQ